MPRYVAPATPDDLAAVASLLFHDSPPAVQLQKTQGFLRLLRTGVIDTPGILLLWESEPKQAMGVLLVQFTPGDAAVVLLPTGPTLLPSSDDYQLLINALHGLLKNQGIQLAHLFATDEERPQCKPLQAIGFEYITQLASLRANVVQVPLSGTPPVQLVNATACQAEFDRCLIAVGQNSQDIPEANVGRSPEQVVARFRQTGPHTPHWWLAYAPDGRPVGVLLLLECEGENWELTYLGVLPNARGQGYARAMLLHAINTVARRQGHILNLMVDIRNSAAFLLYLDCGFRSYQLQHIYLWRDL